MGTLQPPQLTSATTSCSPGQGNANGKRAKIQDPRNCQSPLTIGERDWGSKIRFYTILCNFCWLINYEDSFSVPNKYSFIEFHKYMFTLPLPVLDCLVQGLQMPQVTSSANQRSGLLNSCLTIHLLQHAIPYKAMGW